MIKKAIGEVALVRSGIVLSRKEAPNTSDYHYKQLTLKSITETGNINKDFLSDYYAIEDLKQEYLTQKNDIVVKLSTPYTSTLINELNTNLVIPTHFAVIKTTNHKLNPKYLTWFLNSIHAKKEYLKNNGKSMLATIRPQLLSEIKILLPDIETQMKIGEFYDLSIKERLLLQDLETEKNKLNNLLLLKLYKTKGEIYDN